MPGTRPGTTNRKVGDEREGSMTELGEIVRSPGATTPAPLLAVRNIEVVYDDVILVLRGLSLDVPQGSIVALLGANGAGKSAKSRAARSSSTASASTASIPTRSCAAASSR
jgi:ATPase subunit of ABC transporter with duplicated ATPase domains